MADISPSSRKVDDFLSQLSQLSQDHIQQDHQRQRDLQRSIDLLTPPPKPTRPKPAGLRPDESRPALPKRRDELPPPPLPQRREGTPPPMPARKSLYKPLTVPEKKYRSFTDVEREIQSGETPAKPLVPEKKKPPVKPPVKPLVKPPVNPPAKPETLVRDTSPKPKEIAKAPISEKLPPKIVPKPSSIKAPVTPTKPAVKVPKPSYAEYKQKDNELLFSQLAKIKTAKPAPKPKPKKFDLETVQLKSHMTNLSPTRREAARPSITKYREEDTKLLSQQISRLGKKDPKPPPAPKVSSQDNEDLKEATDFKAHLSSLIRAGTAPTLGSTASSPALERRNTLPTVKREDTHQSGKIAHPTKTRTKGPKRRLPQQLKLTSEKPQQPLKPKPQAQPQKTPPPINKLTKPKAPNPLNRLSCSTVMSSYSLYNNPKHTKRYVSLPLSRYIKQISAAQRKHQQYGPN